MGVMEFAPMVSAGRARTKNLLRGAAPPSNIHRPASVPAFRMPQPAASLLGAAGVDCRAALFDVLYPSRPVDDEGGSVGDPAVRNTDAVLRRHLPHEIAEEWVRGVELLRPVIQCRLITRA